MKRSLKHLAAVGTAFALLTLAAPAASAQDCTTTYIKTVFGSALPEDLVSVTYTPPATVTVSADPAVGFAGFVVRATVTYVDCVV